MRITHVATTLSGGAGIGLQRYHRALILAGIDSRIVTTNSSSFSDKNIGEAKKLSIRFPSKLLQKAGLRVSEWDKMRNRLESLTRYAGNTQYELFSFPFSNYAPEEHPWVEKADIINVHWSSGFVNWQRFFQTIDKPIVLTLHDQQHYLGGFHYSLDAEQNPHLAELESEVKETKKELLSGHKVAAISNSHWNAHAAKESDFFESNTLVETIYYPLNVDAFRPRYRAFAKETFGIKHSQKVIGFACEDLNNNRKGFYDLIEALALLPSSVLDCITLLSFGKNPSLALCEKVSNTWVHLGFLSSEITQSAAYSAMDIFVIPSRAEAFGQTALEAIACGVQVIGSDAGGIPEALVNSPDSLLYPSGQVVELSQLLIQVLENNRSPESATISHERVSQRHSFEKCATSQMNLYKQLINS